MFNGCREKDARHASAVVWWQDPMYIKLMLGHGTVYALDVYVKPHALRHHHNCRYIHCLRQSNTLTTLKKPGPGSFVHVPNDLQVMALIAYLMEHKHVYGPHLIIVPNAVIVNWKSELQQWLPGVKCVYYVGSKDERARKLAAEVCCVCLCGG
jgi:hypothetical protein